MPKHPRMTGLLAISALLAACSTTPAPTTQPPVVDANPSISTSGSIRYVSNEIVVGYDSEAALQATAAALNGEVLRRIPEIHTALIRVPGDALKTASLATTNGIRYATVNSVMTPEQTPVATPSNLSAQAAAADQVFDQLPQYALDPRHLNAKVAWDKGLTGRGVTVALIDDPADVTHPDLAPNWAGKAFDPRQEKTYTDGAAWSNYFKKAANFHGTYVSSSMIAAKNGQGIVGLAYEAKFLPVVMFNPSGYSSFEIALGAVWATNNGARVINNSWGGGVSFGPVKDAFDYAMSRGTTIVASMGNSYHDEFQYPAALPGVIASGALDASHRKVTFSTSGRHISSAAPGQDTMLANPTWLGGGYALISGTSFSSPYTAALAALVLQKCPSATPYQVRRVMEMTADGSIGTNPAGFDRETGYGRLDAGKMAEMLTDCTKLPEKGANVHVNLAYVNGQGTQKGILGDVILRGQGMRAGATDDPTPLYLSPTDDNGDVRFSEIKPGTYDMYVAGPDVMVTGATNDTRGTFVGTVTATSGTTYFRPDQTRVLLPSTFLDMNPSDPYEPNDSEAEAAPIAYGTTTQQAYIYGQPQDFDFFSFTGSAGDQIKAEMLASAQLGGQLDAYLYLLDSTGAVIAFNDDRGTPRIDSDAEINFTLPTTGTYYLVATSFEVASGKSDDSPFNKYKLKLSKTN